MSLQRASLLRGEKVRLAALTEADLPNMVRWSADTFYLRLLDTAPAHPHTEAYYKEWLDKAAKNSTTFVFTIREAASDEMVGFLELDEIQWPHGVAGLGIGIGGQENRGKGYGSEAIELALDFAFQELNLYRIHLSVFEYNERAIALYERLGFRREGAYREFINRDGQRYDLIMYGMLRREWAGRAS